MKNDFEQIHYMLLNQKKYILLNKEYNNTFVHEIWILFLKMIYFTPYPSNVIHHGKRTVHLEHPVFVTWLVQFISIWWYLTTFQMQINWYCRRVVEGWINFLINFFSNVCLICFPMTFARYLRNMSLAYLRAHLLLLLLLLWAKE